MQLDAILEVAIGLVFVWLVISVASMEVQNFISNMRNWRANHLAQSILSMLKDEATVAKFYEHPLIMELAPKDMGGKTKKDKKGAFKLPEQIPSAVFARVACEIMINAGNDTALIDTVSLDEMKASVKALLQKNPNLGRVNQYLMPKIDKATDSVESVLEKYRKNTEAWFDNVMTQASNAYGLNAQRWSLVIGFILAILLNIDTIHIAQKLWQEPTLRAAIVAQAQSESGQEQPSNAASLVKSLSFPIGWTTTPLETSTCTTIDMIDWQIVFRSAGQCRAVTGIPAFNNLWGWIVKFIGYLLSAAAAAQGAPFWFDILRKLVSVKPQISPAEEKKN